MGYKYLQVRYKVGKYLEHEGRRGRRKEGKGRGRLEEEERRRGGKKRGRNNRTC